MGIPERRAILRRVHEVDYLTSRHSIVWLTAPVPSRTAKLTNGLVSYGTIPKSQWEPPEWIDSERAQEGRDQLSRQGVVHAGKARF